MVAFGARYSLCEELEARKSQALALARVASKSLAKPLQRVALGREFLQTLVNIKTNPLAPPSPIPLSPTERSQRFVSKRQRF